MRPTLVLTGLVLAAIHCAPSVALADPEPIVVRDSSFQLASSAQGAALRALRVHFPRAVLDAAYDSTTHVLVVRLEKRRRISSGSITETAGEEFYDLLVAYHTTRHEVLWQRWTPSTLAYAFESVVVLQSDTGVEVWDEATGKQQMSWSGRARLLPGTRQLLRIENGHVRALALPALSTDWDAEVEGPAKRIDVQSDGEQVFLIGDALTTVDVMTGQSWQLDTPLRRRTPLGARFTVGRFEITGLGSMPVRVGDDLFFAADSEAMRLHAHNGMPRWRRALDFDPRDKERRRAMGMFVSSVRSPGNMIMTPVGPEVAVIGRGILWFNGGPAYADPPAIALLDPVSGRFLRGTRLDTTRFVGDYQSRAGQHYFVGDGQRVTRYDSLLVPRQVWRPERIDLPVFRFAYPTRDRILVMAATDLIELDPITLKEQGRVRTGLSPSRVGLPGWYAGAEALVERRSGITRRYARRADEWRSVDGIETSRVGQDALILWYADESASTPFETED